MADHRSISGALPWYAAQTLDDVESREVERHLETCDDCRDRLSRIRQFAQLGTEVPTERALEHVAPGLLVEYAENPEALDEETLMWIEGRLAACATCRDAYDNLRQVGRDLARTRPELVMESTRARFGLWDWLCGSLLRPAPALAYLLIAAIGLPALWFLRTPGDPSSALPVVIVTGERVLREGPSATEPITIDVGDPDQPLVLELVTDLAEEDLRPGAMGFAVELSSEGELIRTLGRDSVEFLLRDGRAVLPLLLDLSGLDVPADYRVTIRVKKAGDPLDGQALFGRELRLRRK